MHKTSIAFNMKHFFPLFFFFACFSILKGQNSNFRGMKKKIIQTENAPQPIGPYSQAVKAGDFLFVSGQIAIDPTSGNLNMADIATETSQVMHNIGAILMEAGLDYKQIVKTSIFLKSMDDFNTVNEVYGSFFKKDFPARETVQVAGLPKNVNVEISVTALFKK